MKNILSQSSVTFWMGVNPGELVVGWIPETDYSALLTANVSSVHYHQAEAPVMKTPLAVRWLMWGGLGAKYMKVHWKEGRLKAQEHELTISLNHTEMANQVWAPGGLLIRRKLFLIDETHMLWSAQVLYRFRLEVIQYQGFQGLRMSDCVYRVICTVYILVFCMISHNQTQRIKYLHCSGSSLTILVVDNGNVSSKLYITSPLSNYRCSW